MTDYLLGVDVSHWQGVMDWRKAKDAGVQFAFIKATEGVDYVDYQLKNNVAGCQYVDMPFAIYHFWRPLTSPLLQYNNIIKAWEYANKPPIVLDVEDTAGLTPKQNMETLVLLIQLLVDKTGKLPTIYTSNEKWKRVDPYPRWKELPLWVANYKVSVPLLPRDWKSWYVWQYTSEGNGAWYGAKSKVIDLNIVKPAYLEYYGIGQQQPPAPPPVPQPTMPEILTEIIINGVKYTGEMRR